MKKLLLFLSIFCLTKQAFGAEASNDFKLDLATKDAIVKTYVNNNTSFPTPSGLLKKYNISSDYLIFLIKKYKSQLIKKIHELLKHYKENLSSPILALPIPFGKLIDLNKVSPITKQLIKTNDFVYLLIGTDDNSLRDKFPEDSDFLKLLRTSIIADIEFLNLQLYKQMIDAIESPTRYLPYCIQAKL